LEVGGGNLIAASAVHFLMIRTAEKMKRPDLGFESRLQKELERERNKKQEEEKKDLK